MVASAFGRYAAIEIIKLAAEYVKEHEETRREYIRANRDAIVTALNNERDCILAYFEHRFAERRSALEEFYALLRSSVESGDANQMQTSLTGILGIIKDNPLDDLVEFSRKWRDPNFKVEL